MYASACVHMTHRVLQQGSSVISAEYTHIPSLGWINFAGDGDGVDFDAFSNHEIDALSVGGPGSTVTGQFVTEITVR